MSFRHTALLYTGPAQLLRAALAYIAAAREAGRPVLVAVPDPAHTPIRDALAGDEHGVTFWNMATAGRNPGRVIPALLGFCAAHPGRRPAILNQTAWAGRAPAELAAAAVHEALTNLAFADVDATTMCAYDAGSLRPSELAAARRTHPCVDDGHAAPSQSADYAPDTALAEHNRPLPPPPSHATAIAYRDPGTLRLLRHAVKAHAETGGLPAERAEMLQFVVTELATNTMRHTPGGGTLHLWTANGSMICQVTDAGHLTDPLAGRRPAPPTQAGGRGLLLTHELCDLVETFTGPACTTIRVHMDRAPVSGGCGPGAASA